MNPVTTIETLARTAWAEARSGGIPAMTHIANVVLNRVAFPRWWGRDIGSVCLTPFQFSCWDPRTVGASPDKNYRDMIAVDSADADYRAALDIARDAVAGRLIDATGGADSYYAHTVAEPPPWTHGATRTLDDACHSFWITRHLAHAPAAYRPQPVAVVSEADALNAAELAKLGPQLIKSQPELTAITKGVTEP